MNENPILTTDQGELLGVDEGVLAFYDIPYAEDMGRFQKAVPADSWEGIRDGRVPGPVFPQNKGRLSFVMGNKLGEKNQSEDAFTVNVWTPTTEGKRPVLFWLHGGGFMTGGGCLPWHNGSELSKRGDIVVVTVNYRLGVLGNLCLPGTADENIAVEDVRLALEWTKENIASFGGDPENITVAGQSCGAWYAVALMGDPRTCDLFHKVSLYSYPGGIMPRTEKESKKLTKLFLKKLDLKRGESVETVDISRILAAQAEVGKKYPVVSFIPTQGDSMPEDLISAALEHASDDTVLRAHVLEDEMTAFMATRRKAMSVAPHRLLDKILENMFGRKLAQSVTDYCKETGNKDTYRSAVTVATRDMFTNGSEEIVERFREAGMDAAIEYPPIASKDDTLRGCHCMDLPYIFGNWEDWKDAPMLKGTTYEEFKELSDPYREEVLELVKR